MSVSITFRPLFVEADGPVCSVLRIDNFTILLDCGWTDDFNEADLDVLKNIIPEVDAVFISFPDIHHMGALPYLVATAGLVAPIYATLPVRELGEKYLYDVLGARRNLRMLGRLPFTDADIDAAISRITTLSFSSETRVSHPRGQGIVFTPFPAGRIIGGSFWKISKETEVIVYAIDFNHTKDKLLDVGCMETAGKHPTVLITDAYNALHPRLESRNMRRKHLFQHIFSALQKGGNVLIPVDTGRALETAYLLNELWLERGMVHDAANPNGFPLVFLSPVAVSTLDSVRTMQEWLNEELQLKVQERLRALAAQGRRTAESSATVLDDLLRFRAVRPATALEHLRDVLARGRPTVVLVTTAALEGSFADTIIPQWLAEPRNSVILTERTPSATKPGSLAAALFQAANVDPVTGAPLSADSFAPLSAADAAAAAGPMPVQVFSAPLLQQTLQSLAAAATAGAPAQHGAPMPAGVTVPPALRSAAQLPLATALGRPLPPTAAAAAASAASASVAASGAGDRVLLYSGLARVRLQGRDLGEELETRRAAAELRRQERAAQAQQRAQERAKQLAMEEVFEEEADDAEIGAAAPGATPSATAGVAAAAAAAAADADPLSGIDLNALGLSRAIIASALGGATAGVAAAKAALAAAAAATVAGQRGVSAGSSGAATGPTSASTLLAVTPTPFAMFTAVPLNREQDYTTTPAAATRTYGTHHALAAAAQVLGAAPLADADTAADAAAAPLPLPALRASGPGLLVGPAPGVTVGADPFVAVGTAAGAAGWDAYGEKADLTPLARVAAAGAGPRSQNPNAAPVPPGSVYDVGALEWTDTDAVEAIPGTGEYARVFERTRSMIGGGEMGGRYYGSGIAAGGVGPESTAAAGPGARGVEDDEGAEAEEEDEAARREDERLRNDDDPDGTPCRLERRCNAVEAMRMALESVNAVPAAAGSAGATEDSPEGEAVSAEGDTTASAAERSSRLMAAALTALSPAVALPPRAPAVVTVSLLFAQALLTTGVLCRAAVEYVPLDGRSDGPSIVNIIERMAPRKLVIARGAPAARRRLAADCASVTRATQQQPAAAATAAAAAAAASAAAMSDTAPAMLSQIPAQQQQPQQQAVVVPERNQAVEVSTGATVHSLALGAGLDKAVTRAFAALAAHGALAGTLAAQGGEGEEDAEAEAASGLAGPRGAGTVSLEGHSIAWAQSQVKIDYATLGPLPVLSAPSGAAAAAAVLALPAGAVAGGSVFATAKPRPLLGVRVGVPSLVEVVRALTAAGIPAAIVSDTRFAQTMDAGLADAAGAGLGARAGAGDAGTVLVCGRAGLVRLVKRNAQQAAVIHARRAALAQGESAAWAQAAGATAVAHAHTHAHAHALAAGGAGGPAAAVKRAKALARKLAAQQASGGGAAMRDEDELAAPALFDDNAEDANVTALEGFDIEGVACDDALRVRQVLYEQFNIL
jgi:Cft2 family RNA processing exonuclease